MSQLQQGYDSVQVERPNAPTPRKASKDPEKPSRAEMAKEILSGVLDRSFGKAKQMHCMRVESKLVVDTAVVDDLVSANVLRTRASVVSKGSKEMMSNPEHPALNE